MDIEICYRNPMRGISYVVQGGADANNIYIQKPVPGITSALIVADHLRDMRKYEYVKIFATIY